MAGNGASVRASGQRSPSLLCAILPSDRDPCRILNLDEEPDPRLKGISWEYVSMMPVLISASECSTCLEA